MKTKLLRAGALFLALAMLLSILTACAPSAEMPSQSTPTPASPLTVTDQADRLVSIEKMPEKIISLAPSNTEILYALGLEDRLVGVTEFCDYPEAAKEKPQIGGFSEVNTEKVVEIQPDLILATNIHKDEVVPELEMLGLTVFVLDPETIDEIMTAISLVGHLTGNEDRASQLLDEIRGRIEAVTEKTASLTEAQRLKVLYILWHDPLMTVGAKTLINELIEKAGGVNIAGDLEDDYPTISMEAVIQANPQVIIAGGGHGDSENLPYEFAMNESRMEGTPARQNDMVYTIDSDLTSRPSPRIVDGLEILAKMIHPEIFGANQ